jgi:hypothetical protein
MSACVRFSEVLQQRIFLTLFKSPEKQVSKEHALRNAAKCGTSYFSFMFYCIG